MTNTIKNEVPDGFVLLQRHDGKPCCAACLDGGRFHGWLMAKHPDGQWVSQRKLESWEVMQAEDQRDYGIVHETSAPAAVEVARQPDDTAELRAELDELQARFDEQNTAFHVTALKLKHAEENLARQPDEPSADEAEEVYPAGYSPCIEDADGLPKAMRNVIQSGGSHGSLVDLYAFIDVWGEKQRAYAGSTFAAPSSQAAPTAPAGEYPGYWFDGKDSVPHSHPDYGQGVFFTHDCAKPGVVEGSQAAPDAKAEQNARLAIIERELANMPKTWVADKLKAERAGILAALNLAAPAATAELTDEQRDDYTEGVEILGQLIESIERHGNYSQEATLTFLHQIKHCFAAQAAQKGA